MRGVEGVTLTAQVKEDVMGKLKFVLEQGRFILPRENPQLPVQMTVQQCEPTKSGTHDDQLWALGLVVYANEQAPPSRHYGP